MASAPRPNMTNNNLPKLPNPLYPGYGRGTPPKTLGCILRSEDRTNSPQRLLQEISSTVITMAMSVTVTFIMTMPGTLLMRVNQTLSGPQRCTTCLLHSQHLGR